MIIRKICSAIILSILCANMLTFTSFAVSHRNSFELREGTNEESFVEPKILEASIENANEKKQILNALNNSAIDAREVLFEHDDEYTKDSLNGLKNKQDLSFGEPYKVVVFSKNIIDALNEKADISEAIEISPYYWEVPILNNKNKKVVSTCIVDKIDSKWEVVSVGSDLNNDNVELSSNYKDISELMKKKNIKDIKYFAHIRYSSIKYDILYAKTDIDEYFIPLAFGDHEAGKLKEKGLYNRDRFMKIIGPILEEVNKNNSEFILTGEAPIITGEPPINRTKPAFLRFIENVFSKLVSIFK